MDRIGIHQRLSQGAFQQMALQPRMLQAIEVLQLQTGELSAFLRQAFEENEALHLVEPSEGSGPGEPGGPGAGDPRDGGAHRDSGGRRGTRADSDRHDELLHSQPAPQRTCRERVAEQLAMLDLAPRELEWTRFLVDCLDEGGTLTTGDAELLALAAEAGLEGGPDDLARGVARLQSLEPRGIGGRSAVEAVLLQLDPRHPDYRLLCRLLEEFLQEISANKLPAVARAMGLEIDRLNELLEQLRGLNPRPASDLVEETAPPIHPDVVVEETAQGFEVRVDQSGLPAVRVEEGVRELAADPALDRDVRRYLRDKLNHARWVVDAVEQRRRTLLRVATTLFGRQQAFLEHGPGHLLPLRMNELAEWLQIHVSTVSRAVAGKHAQTPWGIFPLRYFFQASAGAASDSAREDVRDVVRCIVEGEDAREPFSDDAIVLEMARRGWTLARRTVAKYRKELGIPSSYRRRRYESR